MVGFAGAVSLGVGEIEQQFLILAGLAVISTLILVLVPLRSIAKGYSEYLSYLLESGNQQKSELRVKNTAVRETVPKPLLSRAGFCLGLSVYAPRETHLTTVFQFVWRHHCNPRCIRSG